MATYIKVNDGSGGDVQQLLNGTVAANREDLQYRIDLQNATRDPRFIEALAEAAGITVAEAAGLLSSDQERSDRVLAQLVVSEQERETAQKPKEDELSAQRAAALYGIAGFKISIPGPYGPDNPYLSNFTISTLDESASATKNFDVFPQAPIEVNGGNPGGELSAQGSGDLWVSRWTATYADVGELLQTLVQQSINVRRKYDLLFFPVRGKTCIVHLHVTAVRETTTYSGDTEKITSETGRFTLGDFTFNDEFIDHYVTWLVTETSITEVGATAIAGLQSYYSQFNSRTEVENPYPPGAFKTVVVNGQRIAGQVLFPVQVDPPILRIVTGNNQQQYEGPLVSDDLGPYTYPSDPDLVYVFPQNEGVFGSPSGFDIVSSMGVSALDQGSNDPDNPSTQAQNLWQTRLEAFPSITLVTPSVFEYIESDGETETGVGSPNLTIVPTDAPENQFEWKTKSGRSTDVLESSAGLTPNPRGITPSGGLYAWDWGRPAFCRQKLLSLGFTAEQLSP